jgi:hypothetical protein
VEVSSGDDTTPKIDILVGKKNAPFSDDTEGEGVSSAEPIAPDPISSSMSEQADPSAADRVKVVVSSTGRHTWKCPSPIPKPKQSKSSTDQVMTQIELPPYRGSRSPLDLVDVEIIFGHLFVAFRHASEAAGTGTSAGDDTRPPKKTRAPMLKTIPAPK